MINRDSDVVQEALQRTKLLMSKAGLTLSDAEICVYLANAVVAARDAAEGTRLASDRFLSDFKVAMTTTQQPVPDAMREALLKYLDIFLHPNLEVNLSGLACKHGLAIEACPARECSNPMAYETAIKRARDYITGLSLHIQPVSDFYKETLYHILSRSIPQDMIDGIWQEIKEAGIFSE